MNMNWSKAPHGADRVLQDGIELHWGNAEGQWYDTDDLTWNTPAILLEIVALRDESTPLQDLKQELDVTRQRAQDAIKEANGLRKEAAEAYKKLRGVTRGENAYQFECTEKGPFFVRVKVLYEVTDGDEVMMDDVEKLEDAERYCKQFNIEDRMGDGRVDFGGNTPNELGSFIEENQQWVRNILALQPDVEAYLATLPSEDE